MVRGVLSTPVAREGNAFIEENRKLEITMVKGSEEEEHKVCSEEPSVTF